MLHGELWQAVATDGRVGAGERVSVERMDGLLLTVRRAPGTLSPAPPRPASPAMSKSGKARRLALEASAACPAWPSAKLGSVVCHR